MRDLVVAVDEQGRPCTLRAPMSEQDWLQVVRGERLASEWEREIPEEDR